MAEISGQASGDSNNSHTAEFSLYAIKEDVAEGVMRLRNVQEQKKRSRLIRSYVNDIKDTITEVNEIVLPKLSKIWNSIELLAHRGIYSG